MKSIELIVSDLDGTLIFDEINTNQIDIETIKSLQSDDYKFIIATGRTFKETKRFADLFELSNNLNLVICNNGAVVTKASKFEPIFEKDIDNTIVKSLFEISKEIKSAYYAFYGDGSFCYWNEIDPIPNKLIDDNWLDNFELIKYNEEEVSEKKILQVVFFVSQENEKEFLEKTNVFRNDVEFYKNVYKDVIFYCLNPKSTSKGSALEFVCNNLKIDLENVIAFGDDYNDLSMFDVAGVSIAMDNAPDQVKNKATAVTKNVLEAGVADYLNYLMTSLE